MLVCTNNITDITFLCRKCHTEVHYPNAKNKNQYKKGSYLLRLPDYLEVKIKKYITKHGITKKEFLIRASEEYMRVHWHEIF